MVEKSEIWICPPRLQTLEVWERNISEEYIKITRHWRGVF